MQRRTISHVQTKGASRKTGTLNIYSFVGQLDAHSTTPREKLMSVKKRLNKPLTLSYPGNCRTKTSSQSFLA